MNDENLNEQNGENLNSQSQNIPQKTTDKFNLKAQKIKGSASTKSRVIWWTIFAILAVFFSADALASSITKFADIGTHFSNGETWAGLWEIIRQLLLWIELFFFTVIFIFSAVKVAKNYKIYSKEREAKSIAYERDVTNKIIGSKEQKIKEQERQLKSKDKKLAKKNNKNKPFTPTNESSEDLFKEDNEDNKDQEDKESTDEEKNPVE
ncbi:MAG: hypothetical protein GQ557_00875 [Mycoplasmataceae bacterium]|nr:hypothetical protein [Mycoplasmataceae bacterium]